MIKSLTTRRSTMKKLTLIAALILATVGVAHADYTANSLDKKTSAQVHSAGAVYGNNDNNELQVQAYITVRYGNGEMDRSLYAVTGCDREGGHIGKIKANSEFEDFGVWMMTGDSVMDGMAFNACKVAVDIYAANKKTEKASKVSSKNGI
jgi:hypothetical protein